MKEYPLRAALLAAAALTLATPAAAEDRADAPVSGEHAGQGSHSGAGHEHAAAAKAPGGHGDHASQEKAGHDHSAHDHVAGSSSGEPETLADVDLRDRVLVDQDGRERRFVDDIIGDRIVVMDFVFTTCTNVCPILSAVMSQVRHSLGERVGEEVQLVSITVDPVRDTPERLKAYAAKYGARTGWTWLTGPKGDVDDVLTGLGAYSPSFEDHPAMVLVGDGRTGRWSRFFGFPSPQRIVDQVDKLQAARGAAGS